MADATVLLVDGAAFIYTRYRKGWSIPAYLLAELGANSRHCADKHFDDDILGDLSPMAFEKPTLRPYETVH